MKKHLKNIDLHKYDKAVKFLTRPFDNNLSFDQALAIQTLIDKVEYLQQRGKAHRKQELIALFG